MDADRLRFAEALFVLGDVFNEPVTDARAEAYFDALKGYDTARVLATLKAAISTSKFFPRPADLREMLDGDAGMAADAAWAAVQREIRRVGYLGSPSLDERALEAVKSVFGGWARMCERLPADGPELLGWMKQFKQTYTNSEVGHRKALAMGDVHPNVRSFIEAKRKAIR